MKILEVLPTYPGDPLDGSAVYERRLNRALVDRGNQVEVLTTRAHRIQPVRPFLIRWPDELAARDEHEGIQIRRFHALHTRRVGCAMSDAVIRRWSREDFIEGALVPGSARFIEVAVERARRRPKRFDLQADIGRGPLAPTLIAHLLKCAKKFDVILAGYSPFSLARQVLWAAARAGVPVVLLPFIHENDRYHQFNSLFHAYERAAAVLTLSRHTSDFLSTYVPHANPVTLGAGVTIPATDTPSADEFRARHGLGNRPLVLYVGRKEPGKRYDLAVDAVGMIPGDALLVMVGRDVDGEVIDSDRVRQLGVLSAEELAGAYEACDVFVLPSEFESFGMVFLDAWLRSKPVIGNFGCGAARSLIDDGVDGFLCRNAREIATSVRRLLEEPLLAARMGAAGRAKTLTDYTWERVADRALEVFHYAAEQDSRLASAHERF